MKYFRRCFYCGKAWETVRDYLKDDGIIFDGTRARKGCNYVLFFCTNCGHKHEFKRERLLSLEPDLRVLLIRKLKKYIDAAILNI